MNRGTIPMRGGAVLALIFHCLMLAMTMIGCSVVGTQVNHFPGNPPITPRWAFEPWVWEDNQNTQDSIVNLVGQYHSRNIPVGAVIIDSPWSTCYNNFVWNKTRYPNPQQMIDNFHGEEVRVLMWLTGYLNNNSKDTAIQDCVNGAGESLFEKVNTLGYAVDNGDPHHWWKCQGATNCGRHVDFTNADARAWWHAQLDTILTMGIDGWKTDQGAFTLGHAVMTSMGNLPNKEFRQFYYADIFDYSTSSSIDPFKEKISFARPIGATDQNSENSEEFASVSRLSAGWGGDYSGDFDGLGKQMNHLYRSAAAGYGAPGIEVGGFFGFRPTKRSLIRYVQLGALSPIMENGGRNGGCRNPQCTGGEHLPWHHDKGSGDSHTVDIYRYYATLHSELTPYLFSYSVEANQTGLSIIRDSDEAMGHHRLGEELFISVITEDGDTVAKTVTFPETGNWIDYWKQDTVYAGGSSLTYRVSLETYPIFIKAGAIIPTNASVCRFCKFEHGGIFGRTFSSIPNGWPTTDHITLNIFPSDQSSFTFHQPQGDGIAFENIMISVDESTGTIHVKGQSRQWYRLRVKSLRVPTSVSVEGVIPTWHYDATHQYVIIDVNGSDFTITIDGLTGYSWSS